MTYIIINTDDVPTSRCESGATYTNGNVRCCADVTAGGANSVSSCTDLSWDVSSISGFTDVCAETENTLCSSECHKGKI